MSEPNDPERPHFSPTLFNARLWWIQIRTATAYLTRFPAARGRARAATAAPITAARAFPLVGAALGLTGGLAYGLGAGLGFPPLVAALLGIGTLILAAGARPEEALSRLVEGFGRGSTVKRKLAVMGETRIGALGAIGLMLALGARIGAVADLREVGVVISALVTAAAVSRIGIPVLVRYLDPAPPGAAAGAPARPEFDDLLVGAGLALLLALLALGWTGLLATLAAAVGLLALAVLAKRQIGGHTEQVLGSAQQVAEVAFLVILAAVK